MKLETTLSSRPSIETHNASPAPGPATLRRMVDNEIANLSGGIFDATPFVERPLDAYFPQSRRMTRRELLT